MTTLIRAAIKACCALAAILWAGFAQAQIPMVNSTQAPVPGYFDQAYLPGPVVEANDTIGSSNAVNGYAGVFNALPPNSFSGDNDAQTYVSNPDRQSKAQSFTTGSSPLGYTLKSFTFQQVQGTNGAGGSGNGWINNGTYFTIASGDSVKVRVGSLSGGAFGTSYTTLLETNATYAGTSYNTGGTGSALGIYFNFDLSGANLTLSPNTTYFVEIMATASDHFELNSTMTNPISGNFPSIYLNGQALVGQTTADLDRTGAFRVVPNGGVFAFDASLAAVGAPGVVASVKPTGTATNQPIKITAVVTPGLGTVTNVYADLSAIAGSAKAALVLSNGNVYTNTFVVPVGAHLGTTNLTVIAQQNAIPNVGGALVPFTVLAGAPPAVVRDTNPTNSAPILAVNEGVTFSAVFSGVQPIFYNWQVSYDNGYSFTDIPNATNTTFTITNAQVSDTGYYLLQASNAFGVTITTPSLLLVDNTYNPTYLWSALIPFANLTAEQILTNFPAGNKIAGALVAKNGGAPITVVLTNAGSQPIVFSGAGNWAALSGGTGFSAAANINTNQTGNSSFNSVLNNGYTDNATHTITLSNLVVGMQYQVQLFALDDRSGLTPVNSSRYVNFQDPNDGNDIVQNYSMADNVYVIGTFTATNSVMSIQQNMLTTTFNGNFNCLVLRTVGWNPAPYVTQSPANVSGFLGTNVSLTAGAADDTTAPNPAITYQWASGPTGGPYTNLVEGSKYAGTATGTLTISNLTTDDAIPAYVLIAANSMGSVTTKEANVYFQALPVPPAPGSYGAYALSNNPVAFWMLNETNNPATGLLVAYDATGHGHNGTYQPAASNAFTGVLGPQPPAFPGFAANQGALQTAANTPASEVFIPPFSLNTNPFAISTNGVTIAMWIKPSQGITPNTGLFFYRNNTVQGFGFGGNTSGGMAELGYDWNGDSAATYNFHSGLFPPLNVWSYVGVAITSNSATFFLYYTDPISGLPVRLSAVNAIAHNAYTFTGGNTRIGGDPNNANRTFAGAISSVAIYNTALSSGQLIQQYAAGIGVAGVSPLVSGESPNFYFPAPLAAGRSVTITATANGTVPLTNQWAFNGTNVTDGSYLGATVSGSQTTALTVSNLSYNNAGSYQLLVTNAYGQTNSKAIQVTVLPATLVGQWLAVSNVLADTSGFTPPGTHDASVQSGSVFWTNDVPAIAPLGSASLFFTNAGLIVANSATTDAGYTNTFDNKINSGITVMCWAKGWPTGQWNPWVSKYGENGIGWQLRRNGGTVNSCWTTRSAVGGGDMSAYLNSNDGNWHHYAGTLDPVTGIKRLYVDGQLVATGTGNGAVTMGASSHLMIGARDNAGTIGNQYSGEIYDVRVYNYALPQSQVVAVKNGQPVVQPQDYFVTAGAFLTFTTTAINAAPPYSGYQWQFNGANLSDGANNGATISGSSTISMTITNITANNAGVYQLLVTNATLVTTSAVARITVLPPTEVGRWLSGTQSLADGSGFSPAGVHDAAVTNGTYGWSADVPASAPVGSFSLAFTNSGLIVSNSSVYDAGYTNTFDNMINNGMTVMCWAKGFPGAWNPWVSKYGETTPAPSAGWQLRINSGGPNSCWTIRGTGTGGDMTSSIGSNDGQWHHYAGTYNPMTHVRSLYVDGVLAATQTGEGIYTLPSNSHLMIGARDPGGNAIGNYFTGNIYDVRVYNYALTQSQLGATVPGLKPSFASKIFTPGTGGSAGQFVMSWSFGTLLEATNVAGPWNATTNTSPFTNNATLPADFFKLSNP